MNKLVYLFIFLIVIEMVFATEMNSNNYQSNLTMQSGGGLTNASSTTYASSLGNIQGINKITSTAYNISIGFFHTIFRSGMVTNPVPLIQNITNSSITTTGAIIKWDTDLSSNSTVYYGTNTATTNKLGDSSSVTSHSVTLSDLSANTIYYYNVSSCTSSNGCNTSKQYNFRTSAVTPTGDTGTGGGSRGISNISGSGVISTGKVYRFNILEPGGENKIISDIEGYPIVGLMLVVNKELKDVTISVKPLTSKPIDIKEPSEEVYSYLSVDKGKLTDEDIDRVYIEFKIEKSWITNKGLDKDSVTLKRLTNDWIKLPTSYTRFDQDYYYYMAEGDSFSIFTITATALKEVEVVVEMVEEKPLPELKEYKEYEIIGKDVVIITMLIIIIFFGLAYKRLKK